MRPERRRTWLRVPVGPATSYAALANVSYQGLSANATSGDMLKRQQRVLSNILCLARSADCLLIQETKAQKMSPIFERLKDHCTVLHNPHPTSRHQAGTAILMSLRYAQHFDIKEEIIAAGFLQAALLRPKPGGVSPAPSFSSTCTWNVAPRTATSGHCRSYAVCTPGPHTMSSSAETGT